VLDAPQTAAEDDPPDDLEQLGDSHAYGWTLLELLDQAGWHVHVTVPLAAQLDRDPEPGIMVRARHPLLDGVDLVMHGATVADCATPLMLQAGRQIRALAAARREQQ
jgi:hypothetical protein